MKVETQKNQKKMSRAQRMRRRSIRMRLLAVVLCLAMFSTIYSARMMLMAEENVTTTREFIPELSAAKEELKNYIQENGEITGTLYLDKEISVMEYPDPNSTVLTTLPQGSTVSIMDVGQYLKNEIYYQARVTKEEGQLIGYINRKNLVSGDQGFIQWQIKYIKNYEDDPIYEDIAQFPSSYQKALTDLKKKHPDWVFVKMDTGLSWSRVVNSQVGNHSLIYRTAPESYKNGMYMSDKNWYYASEGILKYYLDPRNFLTERAIFQFEQLAFNGKYHTESSIQKILQNSFMNGMIPDTGKTYAKGFVEIGQKKNVSPILLATRVLQEQGSGGSVIISGTYPGYEGYYNYYNIGATGGDPETVLRNGLQKAKDMGWNTREKALEGGAGFICGSYVMHGQDTLYLQKFDVDSSFDGVLWHNYMQNIQAPSSEAIKVFNFYEKNSMLNQNMVFRIPVYSDMPGEAFVKPGDEDTISFVSSTVENLATGHTFTLQTLISGNESEGTALTYTSSDPTIATVDENGVVTALQSGTVTITCTKTENENNAIAGTATISVVTAKENETIPEVTLEDVVYDKNRTLKDISLPEGFTWVSPNTVPTVNRSTYPVTYSGGADYEIVSADVTLHVTKATPEYKLPQGLQGGAGRELFSIALPAYFTWENPEEVLSGTCGMYSYKASYQPDSFNYEKIEGIQIPVTVVCDLHEYGEWMISFPTCEEDGLKTRSCTACGEKEEIVLPALGHDYTLTDTYEATTEADGLRVFLCNTCKEEKTETIPKLEKKHEHTYESKTEREPSCTVSGIVSHTCSCGDSYETQLDALGHNMENHICKTCGYAVPVYEGPVLGSPIVKGEASAVTDTKKDSEQTESLSVLASKTEATSKTESEPKKEEEKTKPADKTVAAISTTNKTTTTGTSTNHAQKLEVTEQQESAAVETPVPVLTKQELMQLKNSGKDLKVSVEEGIVWTIKADTIQTTIPEQVSLGVEQKNRHIPNKAIKALLHEKYPYSPLELAYEGTFGFDAVLSIEVDPTYIGQYANLFYYDPAGKHFSYIASGLVKGDCTVEFAFEHASSYILVYSPSPLHKGVEELEEQEETETIVEAETTVLAQKETKSFQFSGMGRKLLLLAICFVSIIVFAMSVILIIQAYKESRYFDEDIDDYDEHLEWQ